MILGWLPRKNLGKAKEEKEPTYDDTQVISEIQGNMNQETRVNIIPSVYNNAEKKPGEDKLQVHHYEPLRYNPEYEEIAESKSKTEDASTGSPYSNINGNIAGKFDHFNRDVGLETLAAQGPFAIFFPPLSLSSWLGGHMRC